MIRRLVLDVLKPHNPTKVELSNKLSKVKGVDGVDIITIEIDKNVENVKIVLEGTDIKFNPIQKIIEDSGGDIHSVDEVAAGKKLIKEVKTPQDLSASFMR